MLNRERLTNLRSGTKDFQAFINEIERIIESLNPENSQ